MANVDKVCEVCGVGFQVPEARKDTAKACSRKCSDALTKKRYADSRVNLNCEFCGKPFSVPQCHAARSRCCSRKCAASLPDRKRVTGEAHHMWKGGKTEHSGGYRYIAVQDHPFASAGKYVFEHRIVIEDVMRKEVPDHKFLIDINGIKYLRPEVDVHHINEVKHDNSIANLLACTSDAHKSMHHGKAPMKGETWPEMENAVAFTPYRVACKCEKCGAMFEMKRSSVARGAGKFCSRTCYYARDK